MADCFITASQTGISRLELDLLAVKPQAQGTGIGRRLIDECLLAAREHDVMQVRALVRSENRVMSRLCDTSGFTISQQSYDLHVGAPKPVPFDPNYVKGTHLVPVETLAYSGIWIEGSLTRAGIRCALSVANDRQLGAVGALVAQSNPVPRPILAENGFQLRGTFDWWSIGLKSG